PKALISLPLGVFLSFFPITINNWRSKDNNKDCKNQKNPSQCCHYSSPPFNMMYPVKITSKQKNKTRHKRRKIEKFS
ncbi:MAG: hypothetical protein U9R17_08215, partial [Thermodesulfobacteriota bacterium]|nr:hypothetical protein [Thermodesulfobacteriota bacterium]